MLTEKFKAVFQYVSLNLGTEDGQPISIQKALCLVYIADLEAYRELGQSITGSTWKKGSALYPMIPVPEGWDEEHRDMIDEIGFEIVDEQTGS